mgnify:CR=1 FL=1
MATFKYFIRVTKKKSDKPVNIRIRFYQGRKFDCTALTGKSILPSYWNNKKGEVRDVAEYIDKDVMISELKKLKSFIINAENLVGDKTTINNDWLNLQIDKYYDPEKYEPKKITFFEYIDKFIEESKDRINPDTGRKITRSTLLKYGTCRNYLKDFQKVYSKEIDFDTIDVEFYNAFVKFLSKRKKEIKLKDGTTKIEVGLATNTIGKQIAVLRNFLNSAVLEEKVDVNYQLIKKRFKSPTENTDSIYLDENELNSLYELDLTSNKRLDPVRDIFLVAAWTGLRFSDLNKVKAENIEDNSLVITQTKTDNEVVIPIHPVVTSILKKWNNKLPRIISNQKMNEYLKDLGELAELNTVFKKSMTIGGIKKTYTYAKKELLTTHTARRSFATNLYKRGFPTISIMMVTGHKTETAFLKYIKVTPREHAEKLRKFWANIYAEEKMKLT